MRPHIEPKIQHVKERVTPYVDHSVKKYEMVQDKVEQAKMHGRGQLQKLKSFHGESLEKVRGYKNEKVGKVNKMFRVPSTDDVAGLKHKRVLGKMDLLIRNAEQLIDQWLPAPITESTDSKSDDRYLLPRLLSLPSTIKTRLWHAGVARANVAMAYVQNLPRNLMARTKGRLDESIQMLSLKKTQFLKALVQWEVSELKELAHTNVVAKKAVEITEATLKFSLETCEKTFGKEEIGNAIAKGKAMLYKMGAYLPTSVKEVFAAPAATSKTD
jgi:hypothetical protein